MPVPRRESGRVSTTSAGRTWASGEALPADYRSYREACNHVEVTGTLDSVRAIMRSLAEARDGPFYGLWVAATHVWPAGHPVPEIGFRIYSVAGSDDAFVVVSVSVVRPDGDLVCWSLTALASASCMEISAQVELSTDGGTEQLFQSAETAETSEEATTLIATYARQVCAQRRWLSGS